jgi:hypothetical protein
MKNYDYRDSDGMTREVRDHGMSQGPSPGPMLIVVLLAVFTIFLSYGCRNPSAPKPECEGKFVHGECEEEEPEEEISQELIDQLFVTGMNTPLEGP